MSIVHPTESVNEFGRTRQTEHLYDVLEALPVLVAHVDSGERYIYNNAAFDRWYGLKPGELRGQSMRQFLDCDSYERAKPHIDAALRGVRQEFEAEIRQPDGSQHCMHVQYVPRNEGNELDGFYVLMNDVTLQRDTQHEMLRLNAELEQRFWERTAQLQVANKELEAFCYSVSHDLRAPLRAVRGFTEVLMEQYAGQLDPRGQDFLRRVSDASSKMDRLVEDLLKLSRVSRSEIRHHPIDLVPIAEEIIAGLRKEDPAREVEVSIAPSLPAQGDERLMRLVLDNLLRNAWKFTIKKPQARIELGKMDEPSSAFFVRDNGAGFDMAYASRLFGVFQRLHSANDFPGSGVGLAIVQRVINRHGGRVWAEGALNEGATFYFTLPPSVA
ncbi:MAG TPA: ATP-binding protein [Verrucomicrobiae bacterium]|nr:ATP-binding protein [Verrucomicrobiae bacterium]